MLLKVMASTSLLVVVLLKIEGGNVHLLHTLLILNRSEKDFSEDHDHMWS